MEQTEILKECENEQDALNFFNTFKSEIEITLNINLFNKSYLQFCLIDGQVYFLSKQNNKFIFERSLLSHKIKEII